MDCHFVTVCTLHPDYSRTPHWLFMSRFVNQLNGLLEDAFRQNVINDETRNRLHQMGVNLKNTNGSLSLAAVLSWLGAGIFSIGVILLVSANWKEISDTSKLIGFFLLFGVVHAAGIYFRSYKQMECFAEGLHFVGASLFLMGIGLISQIYHIDGQWSTAILIWLIAIAPLAWCFRSPSITLLSLFAMLLWLHLLPLESSLRNFNIMNLFAIEVGIGVALIGGAAILREREPRIAWAFRGTGLILLFFAVYLMGFYRHFSSPLPNTNGIAELPAAGCLILGAVSLALSLRKLLPENPLLRNKLVFLLASLLVVTSAMLLAELSFIPQGDNLHFFNFGWYRTFHITQWVLSLAAWILWFGLGLWCVFFAAKTDRKTYLNAGVLAVGLGVVTRFFDLMGGLFQTGLAFVVGGAVLLATCYAVEYTRRRIARNLSRAHH